MKWKIKHHTRFHFSVLLVKMCISNPMPLVKHNLDTLWSLQFSNSTAFLTGLQSPGYGVARGTKTQDHCKSLKAMGVEFKEDRCKKARATYHSQFQCCLTNSIFSLEIILSKSYFHHTKILLSFLVS